MMMPLTPSVLPVAAPSLSAALDPQLAAVIAAGEAVEQIEALGQHMGLGHRLERRNVELRQDAAQRVRGCGGAARQRVGTGAILAQVEEDGAAVLHEGVHAGKGGIGGHGRIRPAPASRAAGRTRCRRARC